MSHISVINACTNNLKNVSLMLPLNKWITFIGKSGSGKSTLADVILGGSLSENDCVRIPSGLRAALFRQKFSIPRGDKTIFDYLGFEHKTSLRTLGDMLRIKCDSRKIAVFTAKTFSLECLHGDVPLYNLSLTTFNKVRFIKFLLENNADLLIIDELASGMSYQEAKLSSMVLKEAVKKGCSIIAIEHSLPMVEASDYIVEMGPGAGIDGGMVIFSGDINEYLKSKHYISVLSNAFNVLPERKIDHRLIRIEEINYHNLQLKNFSMPTNCIVNICGLSGSGKTSLLDVIYRALDKSADAWQNRTGIKGEVKGKAYIRRPHIVDQTPIGNNAMSTPATYTKIMDILRDMFSQLPESKNRGYSVAEYSYKSKGGCTQCGGRGVKERNIGEEIIFEPCPACKGRRYKDDINGITIDGLSIGDMLQLPCGDLAKKDLKRASLIEKLNFIVDVGLSYLTLGQPSLSLSGGESQRIKITKELAKKLGDRSLFILDTPSRGLHPDDFNKVFTMLRRLTEKNNSILIADNSPYFMRNADWLIILDKNLVIFQGLPSALPAEISRSFGIRD